MKALKELLAELNKTYCTEIDLAYYVTEDIKSFDDLREEIDNQGGFDIEIIYYSRAIEYLQENDPSLRESLGLASEMGYSLDDLSSEVLASLLASQKVREEFEELESEINEFFENQEEED